MIPTFSLRFLLLSTFPSPSSSLCIISSYQLRLLHIHLSASSHLINFSLFIFTSLHHLILSTSPFSSSSLCIISSYQLLLLRLHLSASSPQTLCHGSHFPFHKSYPRFPSCFLGIWNFSKALLSTSTLHVSYHCLISWYLVFIPGFWKIKPNTKDNHDVLTLRNIRNTLLIEPHFEVFSPDNNPWYQFKIKLHKPEKQWCIEPIHKLVSW